MEETNVGHNGGGLEIFFMNVLAIGGPHTNKIEVLNNNNWKIKTTIGNSAEEVADSHLSTVVLKENKNEYLFVFGKEMSILLTY